MALNEKEERRLARQRGAGPRELKNAAFNFTFGASGPSAQLSTRKTPRPERDNSATTLPSASRDNRRTSTPLDADASVSRASPEAAVTTVRKRFNTPKITGKRKRSSVSQPNSQPRDEADDLETTMEEMEAYKASPAGQVSLVGNRTTQTPKSYREPEELDELSPDMPALIDGSLLATSRRVSIPILPLERPEERPAPSPDRRPPREERGRSRTRKSVVSVSHSQTRSSLGTLNEEGEVVEQDISVDPDDVTTSMQASGQESQRTESASHRPSVTGTFDGGTTAFLRTHAEQSTRREIFEVSDDASSAASDDELIPEPRNKRLRKLKENKIEIHPDTDADGEIENELLDELSPNPSAPDGSLIMRSPLAEISTNTQHKPPRKNTFNGQSAQPDKNNHSSKPASRAKGIMKNRSKYGGPTIPITIWRRSRGSRVADTDPLGEDPIPAAPMTAPDILSQVSTEIISSYMEAIPHTHQRSSHESSSKAARKSLHFQLQTLQSFKDNLADQLRNMSFAQGAAYIFSSEVRRKKKEKRELREELMARRREREALDLEIDAVRKRHLKAVEDEQKRRELVEDVESIEEAVRAGRERAKKRKRSEDDDDLSHDSLSMTVAEVTESLGFLNRVKEFNGFLERAADQLETRH